MTKDKPKTEKIIKKESNDVNVKKEKEPKKGSKAAINYGIVDYPA